MIESPSRVASQAKNSGVQQQLKNTWHIFVSMQRLVSSHPIRARDERHLFARLAVMDMTDQPEIPCMIE